MFGFGRIGYVAIVRTDGFDPRFVQTAKLQSALALGSFGALLAGTSYLRRIKGVLVEGR